MCQEKREQKKLPARNILKKDKEKLQWPVTTLSTEMNPKTNSKTTKYENQLHGKFKQQAKKLAEEMSRT